MTPAQQEDFERAVKKRLLRARDELNATGWESDWTAVVERAFRVAVAETIRVPAPVLEQNWRPF